MCLQVPPFVHTTVDDVLVDASEKMIHANIVCEEPIYFFATDKSGGMSTIVNIPVISGCDVCMAVFCLPPDVCDGLIPCKSHFPCIRKYIDALENPGEYVSYVPDYDYDNQVVYRSLSASSEAARPVKIGPLKIFTAPDGGMLAIIPLGFLNWTDRSVLGPAAVQCIDEGLEAYGIDPHRFYGPAYDGSDMSKFDLVSEVLTQATPGNHILLGINNADEKDASSFTFLHHCNANQVATSKLPFPGQVHGFKDEVQFVEDKSWVLSNDPSRNIVLMSDDAGSISTTFCPLQSNEFVKSTDSNTWMLAQQTFQQAQVLEICKIVNEFLVEHGLHPMDKNEVLLTNIEGAPVPCNATYGKVHTNVFESSRVTAMERSRLQMKFRREQEILARGAA